MKQIGQRLLLSFLLFSSAFSQDPSTQITVKAKSGFLGLGGPRIVQLDLANRQRVLPLTCENVNESDQYSILCSPVGEWQIDIDFVTEELSRLTILQDGTTIAAESSGDIVGGTILLGFPKTVRLHEPLEFVVRSGDSVYRAVMTVPSELWPGSTAYADLERRVQEAVGSSNTRLAIAMTEQALANADFAIFPTYASMRDQRISAFSAELSATKTKIEALLPGEGATLSERILKLDGLVPEIQFVKDSLPRPDLQILSTDMRVAALLLQADGAANRITAVRESLQRAFEDFSIRWILEGSVNGRNSIQFQYMIEALAYAFSTLSPVDTSATQFVVSLPAEMITRLTKQNVMSSYETFMRICKQRFLLHEPIFPPGFLPNLRKDSAAFSQPDHFMLKAVSEFFGGSLLTAQAEIVSIIRTCTVSELVARFDLMRTHILMRQFPPHPDALNLLSEASERLRLKDTTGVLEAGRQLGFIAPTFAYGFHAFGLYYRALNDVYRAQYAFQHAYQLDTLFLSAYLETYTLMLDQRIIPAAIEVLQTALAKGNDSWTVRFNLGFIYLAQSEPAKAITEFEKALVFNQRSYETHIELGLAYQAQKNYSKAGDEFNIAMGIDTMRPEALDRMKKLMEIQRTPR